MDLMQQSPYGTFLEHIKKGELAYQVASDGKALFYPPISQPKTGDTKLEWPATKGLGTVYATTVVYYKGEAPLNVALIDLDEGFRMMSRVEDIDALQVKSGMKVKVKMHPGDEKQPPYPVFTPAGGGKWVSKEAVSPWSARRNPISARSRPTRARSTSWRRPPGERSTTAASS